MTANEKLIDLEFPTAGVSLLQEVQEQPPGTTIVGENVRATNPDGLRARGGTRAGLIRYCANQVPSGAGLIQHLNVIVDPTTERLPQNFLVPDETWVEDPLNPGTFVPPGGWGFPGGAPEEEDPGPTQDIEFVQTFGDRIADLDAEREYDFDNAFDSVPVIGNTMVVAVLLQENVSGANPEEFVTVTNDAGESYTRLDDAGLSDGYERFQAAGGLETSVSLWWKKVVTADDLRIKIDAGNPGCFCEFRMVEYANVAVTSFSGFSFNSGTNDTDLSTGEFDLGTARQMAIAAFAVDKVAGGGSLAVSTPADFTRRGAFANLTQLYYFDDVDHGQEADLDVAVTADNAVGWAAVGAGAFAT